MQVVQKEAFEKLNNFFAKYKELHYKKGEVVLRSEDPPRGVYFITHGFVREHAISEEGKEFTLIIFKPEDFFPIIWAIHGETYRYYFEAITHVDVRCAPREEFLEFLQKNPDVLFELTGRILIRMEGLMSRMEELVFGNAYSKVASIISLCAERFGQESGKNILIPFTFTHRVIANFVGLSRETASLEVKKIERMGLIKYQGRHLLVRNMEGLRDAADSADYT